MIVHDHSPGATCEACAADENERIATAMLDVAKAIQQASKQTKDLAEMVERRHLKGKRS